MTYFILIFNSTHQVIKAESILQANDIEYDIIPTPKEYSSDCGMSIRMVHNLASLEKLKIHLQKVDLYPKIFTKTYV